MRVQYGFYETVLCQIAQRDGFFFFGRYFAIMTLVSLLTTGWCALEVPRKRLNEN